MRRAVVALLATFAFFGLLGFWGDTVQSILGALVLLGFAMLAIEVLSGKE